jgi:hypothetical protein
VYRPNYIRQGYKEKGIRPDYGQETGVKDYCLDAPQFIPTGNQALGKRLIARESVCNTADTNVSAQR